jgi:beta-lactam-binding protein with PASTA domain
VIGTEPAVGTPLRTGTTVTLLISRGSNRVEVPDVTGLDDQQALNVLEEAELAGNVVQRDDDAPAGEVVGQSPGAGRMVPRNAQVTIFVSTGAVSIPDVLGQTRKSAVTELKRAGFSVSITEEPTPDLTEEGRVIDQFPPAGSRGQRGDTVTITVGVAEELPPPTP